jgi:hypothetical protein
VIELIRVVSSNEIVNSDLYEISSSDDGVILKHTPFSSAWYWPTTTHEITYRTAYATKKESKEFLEFTISSTSTTFDLDLLCNSADITQPSSFLPTSGPSDYYFFGDVTEFAFTGSDCCECLTSVTDDATGVVVTFSALTNQQLTLSKTGTVDETLTFTYET